MDAIFSVRDYHPSDAPELLRLLLLLQDNYFRKTALPQYREIFIDKDPHASYSRYIEFLSENYTRDWKIYISEYSGKATGFIIGRYEKDDDQQLNRIGKLEDWFVEEEHRGKNVGMTLFKKLENWFKEKGCQQLQSEIWAGNELSARMREKLGFFVTGILYGRKC